MRVSIAYHVSPSGKFALVAAGENASEIKSAYDACTEHGKVYLIANAKSERSKRNTAAVDAKPKLKPLKSK